MSQKEPTLAELGFVENEDGGIQIDDLVIPAPPIPALSTDVPDSRLIITHLTVRNFKSYAGEQVIGPLNKSFTAVVGPNGSGKSNVIDALMFVFASKAIKIRAKKITALIHNGSKNSNINSCSVSVNFATIKDDHEGVVEDSAFILSRTVHADGTSYYEICNKRVPQKEVIKTLRAYGIDMEYNRFLIMQGEIESISLMNPKGVKEHETGMLEYIEDVIGSNRFIEPLKYFIEKSKVLEVEEKEKHAQLKMVEKEKTDLEGPKNKAVDYLLLENKHILCENSLLHLQRMKVENELQSIVDSKKTFVEEMKSLKADMEKMHESKKTLESKLAEVTKEVTTISKNYEEHKAKFSALDREDAAIMMDRKHAKTKKQSLEKVLEDTKNELNKLLKQLATYEKETSELQIKKRKLEEEKAVDEKKALEVMGSLTQETDMLKEQKDKHEAELMKFQNIMNQKESEFKLTQSELSIYVSDEKKEKDKLSSLISNHEKNIESAKREESLLNEETNQIKVIGEELSSLQEQLSDANRNELSLSQQLKNERLKFEEAKSSQQTSQYSSNLLKGLMREKSRGNLPGIYGRLGDLGAIDEKFDVAISTSCGRLDNIVTDTIATAQECVKYLKDNQLGYATFIALDQMKKYEPYTIQKVSTPENVPRLFDLVRVKDKSLLTAFYFAIGGTLVAADLEQATRIGLQGRERHRVVTLKGELIDLAGTMSGGGGRPMKGRMGQTVVECTFTNEDFARMSAEIEALGRKVSDVKRLRLSLEDQISQKNSKVSSLQHSLRKRKLHCKAYNEQVQMITVQVTEQKKKVAELTVDKKRVSQLEEEVKAKRKSFDASFQETKAVKEKVSKLQDEIVKISKGKLNKAKRTVDQLKKKLDEVTQAITKSLVNMKQSKGKVKKLEVKIQNIESDLKENDNVIKTLKEKQDVLTDKGKETNDLITQAEAELKNCKEKETAVKKEMDSINEKEHQMKRNEIERKNTLKTYESNESEKRALIRNLNSKLGKLKLNAVEDSPTDIPTPSNEEISKLNAHTLKAELDVMKVQLEDMKPDLGAIKEFKKKEKVFNDKEAEMKAITAAKMLQLKRHAAIRKRRLEEFMAGFSIIAKKLKENYQMLAFGGDAELELEESKDPFSKGIEFCVRPQSKSWKPMRFLSGGEKTLGSLALVFALHYYRATPFYVMDEIDAALDARNVAIVAVFLKERTQNAQLIIISLRNVMNELSHHLLGIYKVNNCTKSISLSNVEQWEDDNNENNELRVV